MTTGCYSDKRDRLRGIEVLYELYKKFEGQWFPNKDIDTTIDFLLWLEDKGYEIKKKRKVKK